MKIKSGNWILIYYTPDKSFFFVHVAHDPSVHALFAYQQKQIKKMLMEHLGIKLVQNSLIDYWEYPQTITMYQNRLAEKNDRMWFYVHADKTVERIL